MVHNSTGNRRLEDNLKANSNGINKYSTIDLPAQLAAKKFQPMSLVAKIVELH